MNLDQEKSEAKKGWAGEEMEMLHRREQMRSSDHVSKRQYGTVDLAQFQNKEVGHGYQARGVIRQRNGQGSTSMKIVDMTKKGQEKEDDSNSNISISSSREIRKKRKSRKRIHSEKKETRNLVPNYLMCKPLCDFRRELEKILSESKR